MFEIETAWVKPPAQITGLDHLGAQAPCIHIYGQLLPGITNVTDRARYYSLYPWIVQSLSEQNYSNNSIFIDRFRRADCLLTLIALRHASVSADGAQNHSGAAVGSDQLSRALKKLEGGEAFKLSDYASQEDNGHRYFSNKLGGFKQYYFGVLRDMQVVIGLGNNAIQLVVEIGGHLASEVAAGVPGDLFWQVIDDDFVSLGLLDELAPFCHCQLTTCKAEHEELLRLFSGDKPYNNEDQLGGDEGLARRQGLGFHLYLAQELAKQEYELTIDHFRSVIYSGSLPDETPFKIPDELSALSTSWAAYQRNELLSVALQGLFFSVLTQYYESSEIFADTKALTNWFWENAAGRDVLSSLPNANTFKSLTDQLLKKMPAMSAWKEAGHEMTLASELVRLAGKKSVSGEALSTIITHAITLLAVLYGRSENAAGYATAHFPDRYLDFYPVNLKRFLNMLERDGEQLSPKEFLIMILKEWCLDAHLHVALRKLRQQSRSTFRFRPTDRGLMVVGVPTPVYSSPRFRQAIRILVDLGALELKDGMLRPGPYADRFKGE